LADLDEIDFYRFDLCTEQSPWLESVDGPALRTPLAGLIGITTAFGSGEEEFPPLAAIAREFRPQADLNRPHSPACPTSPGDGGSGRFALGARGRATARKFSAFAAEESDSSIPAKKLHRLKVPGDIYFIRAAGRLAVTVAVVPPRAAKSPVTVIRRGFRVAARSSRIVLITAS
jgi:hypothetical protein